MKHPTSLSSLALLGLLLVPRAANAAPALPTPVELSSGWQLQDVAKIPDAANPDAGAALSKADYRPNGWFRATVPGTVLTTLVNNGVYPEPLYGENNRPDRIPDDLSRTSYWYRTSFSVPRSFAGRRVWLNFNGINYKAAIWVNGVQVGNVNGAFSRGIFDVTSQVNLAGTNALAVLILPPPNPGIPHEQTVANGTGRNGGILAKDGPTFLSSMGWDWIPGIRDRNIGIWQDVTLSATGPVTVRDPYVTSDLPLPRLDSADLRVQTTLSNASDAPQTGVLTGTFGNTTFRQPITLAAGETRLVTLTPETTPALRVRNPRLWWPNGYGQPNLYALHLSFAANGMVSDARDVNFGIREMSYQVPGSENLTISVNGVPMVAKGGNWGMDEAMKRNTRARLDTQVRLHRDANFNMIRNWVGQSTSADFYDACDKYGIMLWDEMFQPNPSDGPNPDDVPLYLANVREKITRFRSHPSIAVWCARNEGFPPPEIDAGIQLA
ncbi:MAG TPA: beta galactosidase jelly roll domain-containing protein, partial [Abditibacterium sp.]